MGAFFTNIQFNTSRIDKTELIENLVEYINLFNIQAGYNIISNEEDADKTVIIVQSNDSNWLAIYDEELEEQDIKKLNKLSSGLSKEFKTTTLSILVNDSDLIYVGLSTNGILKDSLDNLTKEIDFNKNKPDVWTKIFIDNYTFDDVKSAWENKKVFVEDFLNEFAKFTYLDTSNLLTGYNYLNEETPNQGIKLHFAKKDKKKAAEPGLTEFSMLAGAGLLEVKEGEKQTLEWIMTNNGAFSNGLDVVIAGESIDKGLVKPENVKTSYVRPKLEIQNEFTSPFIETNATTGEKIFYARFEDIYIPEGFQPTYPMSSKEAKKYGEISYNCAVRFNITFIGVKNESGDLSIFFSPLINRQEGSYCAKISKGTLEEWMKKNGI